MEQVYKEARTAATDPALPMEARPRLRYWLPAAAVDDSDLVREVEELAARGFGGLELVPLLGTPEEIIDGEDGDCLNLKSMLSIYVFSMLADRKDLLMCGYVQCEAGADMEALTPYLLGEAE